MPENNEKETEKTLKEVVGFFLDPIDYALTDGMRNVKDMLGKMLCEARKVLKEGVLNLPSKGVRMIQAQ